MAGQSASELRSALRRVLPGLDAEPIVVHRSEGRADPRWHSATAVIDDAFVAKFAWSRVAAVRIHREGEILVALRSAAPHLRLPEVVATSSDPTLLVTRLVSGAPLRSSEIAALDNAGLDRAAAEIGGFLAELHDPAVLAQVRRVAPMAVPEPQADTEVLRQRFGNWVSDQQRETVLCWCDWTDTVLGRPSPPHVLVHGDLHGYNQVWDMTVPALRAVVDFDISGPTDAEFDFRYLPSQSSRPDFCRAIVRHYQRKSGRVIDLERVMAWHMRTVLGDALWRSEAAVELPDGGTPSSWVEGLAQRMIDAGVNPQVP
ncbi:MAG: aminoglycoside phosphotransferase family protein [Nocardioidaceae bacterium]|nr:aminoglycoside phosphotransferase family protein [Nocardioidaceae bacterium]